MNGITNRQAAILDFITDYRNNNLFSPSVRDISEYFHISPKGAHDHIIALINKGVLEKNGRKARTLILSNRLDRKAE